jgi:hypothetical protein
MPATRIAAGFTATVKRSGNNMHGMLQCSTLAKCVYECHISLKTNSGYVPEQCSLFGFIMDKECVCCEVGIAFLSIIYIPQTSRRVVNKQCDLSVRDCVTRWASMVTELSLVPPF